jgi:Tol biopolymer transport system component
MITKTKWGAFMKLVSRAAAATVRSVSIVMLGGALVLAVGWADSPVPWRNPSDSKPVVERRELPRSPARPPRLLPRDILVAKSDPRTGNIKFVRIGPWTGKTKETVLHRGVDLPERSPNGRQILFTKGNLQHRETWTSWSDGSHVKRLTWNGRSDSEPDWAPGSHRIVVTRATYENTADLWIIGPHEGEGHRLTAGETPDWSRAGSGISFERDGGIFVVDPLDGSVRRLTAGSWTKATPGFADILPQWSPDGRWILFRRIYFGKGGTALLAIKPDGSKTRVVVPRGSRTPAGHIWSPDGKKVLYQFDSDRRRHQLVRFHVVRFWTHRDHVITRRFKTIGLDPSASWSPDGKRVVYGRSFMIPDGHRRSDLWIAYANGRPGHRLTNTLREEREPNWATDIDTAELR